MRIYDPKLTGSIEFQNPVVGGITASLFGSSSYALTASYALNGGGGGGTPGGSNTQLQYNNSNTFGGVPVATYDGTTLRLTGSFSGSLSGTSSWAVTSSNALTASYVNPLIQNVILTGSLLVTQSYISTVDWIDFTNDVVSSHLEGRISWDVDRKTLQIDTETANFSISAGHVNVLRGRNTNAYTLNAGSVVYISGNSGQFATFNTASYENENDSAYTIGIIPQAITSNQYGYAVIQGEITGINTNAYAPGTLLYLSSSGQYSDTKPVAPYHTVRLGQVIVQSTSGILQVKVDNGYETDELHDVVLANTSSGDLFVKSGSIWINSKQLTGSYGLTGSLTAINGGFTGSLLGTATTASYVRNLYISSSEIANASPAINELWHDAANGKTYIRYKSGSNEIWLLQSDPTIDVTTSLQTLQEVTDLGSTTDNIVTITNTTNATDSGSGALIVSGGAGFRGDVWGKKFYGDGSGLTGITATYTETDTLQTVTTRGNETSTSLFIKSTQNSTAIGIGALRVSGGLSVELDINARNITSSLFGTSSWSINSTTASFVATSSWANNSITASYVTGSIFTSVNPVLSASYALTASYALNGGGGGSGVNVQDEGGASFSSTTLNFVGAGVTAANAGGGTATITIPGGGGDAFPYSGSAQITGSLGVTGSAIISGSSVWLIGNTFITGTLIVSGTQASDIIAVGNLVTSGTLFVTASATNLAVHTQGDIVASGSIYLSASYGPTAIRSIGNNYFTGSVIISSSGVSNEKELIVRGEAEFTGSIRSTNGVIAQSFTGSLFGTASWATNVVNAGGGGGNTFATFSVAGQSNVTASVTSDTLTLVAGSGITITTDATAESITFNSTNTNNFTRGITIADPTNAENATIMFTTSSLTINRITSVIRGTAAPSVTYTLRYAASRSLTGTEVITGGTTVASPFTGSALISSSGFTNPTVPGNNFIWLATTAKSGTVNELFVQFQYT